MTTDAYYDVDVQLERELAPTRNGVLSELALHRIELRLRKAEREGEQYFAAEVLSAASRLLADSKTVRWRLRCAIVDLCGLRQSWGQQAAEVRRLQDRLTKVLSYLTDEQYQRLVADDTARREEAS